MSLEAVPGRRALIGFSGFVGGNLQRQTPFTDFFNSKNIESIAGQAFDLLVCAGAPAEKWKANKDPEADRANLERLMAPLKTVRVKQAVLISTVDVFPVPADVDEMTPLETHAAPYGRHRRQLEEFFEKQFLSLVIRLPGLFGPGLKKNVIYDLLHRNRLEFIHADGQFQYYSLERLWKDVQTALAQGWSVLHLTSEPVKVFEVARAAFDLDFSNRQAVCPAPYNVRSIHASVLGGAEGYVRSKAQILQDIRQFVKTS